VKYVFRTSSSAPPSWIPPHPTVERTLKSGCDSSNFFTYSSKDQDRFYLPYSRRRRTIARCAQKVGPAVDSYAQDNDLIKESEH
jgi:hypothetical protein